MALVGIDIGTTGCKAVCFDASGRQLADAYREYARGSCGVYEIDPEEIFRCVLTILTVLAHKTSTGIVALAVSSFGESFVTVAHDGRALHNAILLTDPRGVEQCRALCERIGKDRIMASTGVNPHPMYSAAKLLWLLENKPEAMSRAWRIFLIEDYVLWRLGAEPCVDPAIASRTMMFDVVNKRWDGALLSAVGVDAAMFSTPVAPGTVVGRLSLAAAADTGLPAHLPLVMGSHDQICASVGSGSGMPGKAVYSMGTSECITPVFDRPILSPEFLGNNYACVPHAVLGNYATYAFTTSGGALVKWFRSTFAIHLEEQAHRVGESVFALLERGAAEQPSRALVIPHFAGSSTPDCNGCARGAIVGLSFDTELGEIYRAVLEGIAFEMRFNQETLRRFGVEVQQLRAVGGGARSRLWLNIKSAILNTPIVSLDIDEAGSAGAAIFAGIATGEFASTDEAASLFAREKGTFRPDAALQQHYNEQYQRYKALRLVLMESDKEKLYMEDN